MSDPNPLPPPSVLFLKDDVAFEQKADGSALLVHGELLLSPLSPGLFAACRALTTHGASLEQLIAAVLQADGEQQVPRLFDYLYQLTERGLLCRRVVGAIPRNEAFDGRVWHHRLTQSNPSP